MLCKEGPFKVNGSIHWQLELVFKSPTQSGFWSKNGATATATSCLYSETQKNQTETAQNRSITSSQVRFISFFQLKPVFKAPVVTDPKPVFRDRQRAENKPKNVQIGPEMKEI